MKIALLGLFVVIGIDQALGHGRMMDPVARASAWRLGFHTPRNYDDNALFCGGFATKQNNGGKCGVCGDPWNGVRENEPPGRFATGVIVKRYKVGQVISTKADITANHWGYMEYRICPHNDVHTPVTQACLDRYVLQRADGLGTRVNITTRRTGMFEMNYKLPEGMTCSQCVIQWKYHAGNSWGVDPVTGRGCIGCGPQEEFYGCADVAIDDNSSSGGNPTNPAPTTTPTTRPPVVVTNPPQPPIAVGPTSGCHAINLWAGNPILDQYCVDKCAIGQCPPLACKCDGQPTGQKVTTQAPATTKPTTRPTTTTTTTTQRPTTTTTTTRPTPAHVGPTDVVSRYVCKAINLWAGNEYLDRWCSDACARGNCPEDSCKCSMVQMMVTRPTTEAPYVPVVTNGPGPNPNVVHSAKVCKAIGQWANIGVFDSWCTDECNTNNNCPPETCQCTDTPLFPVQTTSAPIPTAGPVSGSGQHFTSCTTNGIVTGDYWQGWCKRNCDRGYCAVDYCFCS